MRFFGVWADPQAALDRYHSVAADLHAGRSPGTEKLSGNGLTVKDVCNAFLNWQKDKLDAGEIGAMWFEDCRTILNEFARSLGKHRPADDLQPIDSQRYRAMLSKRLGLFALRRHITAIKSVFKYSYDMDHVEHPMKLGRGFSMPTAAQERKARQKAEFANGKRLFRREELIEILKHADDSVLLAAVLLGMNGGFGNTDCATLPRSAVDLDKGIISYARPKTGVQRVVPLWQETTAALRTVLANHPRPENDEAARLRRQYIG